MNTRKTLIMGNLGLLVILALVIAKLVLLPTQLAENLEPLSLHAQNSPESSQVSKSPVTGDYQDLANSELFGSFGSALSTQSEITKPEVLDHLKLLGTVTGPDPIARAIISNTSENDSKVYRLNEWIDELQLIQIRRNEVTLQHNGQNYQLQRTMPTSTVAPTGTSESAPATLAQNEEPQPVTTYAEFTQEVEVILKAASATSQTQKNQPGGIKLGRIDQFVSTKLSGFREGDIIQSINGHQIISKKQLFQVLQKAKTQPVIDIEVLRDNQTILLSFSQG